MKRIFNCFVMGIAFSGCIAQTTNNQTVVLESASVSATPTATPKPLSEGLVALWHLDGDFRDSSGNGFDLVPSNAPAFGTPGKVGTAVTFNGSNQKACMPYNSGLNPGRFTLSMWAKMNGNQGTIRALVFNRDGDYGGMGGMGFLIYAMSDNTYQYWMGTGGFGWPSAWGILQGPSIVLSQWTHHVILFDGGKIQYYIDGALIAQAIEPFNQNIISGLCIGANAAGGYPVNGDIDEIAIWNRPLSPAEILNVFQNGNTGVALP